MKVAALTILYHPPENIFSNILSYYEQTEKIFVWDNTETKTLSQEFFQSHSKAIYLQDGKNNGIAERLNDGCKRAVSEGFEWLLTMDQDSEFMQEHFSNYLKCIQDFSQKDIVAAFGPSYTDKKISSDNCSFENTNDIITSGMMINLSIYKILGVFDENLFIDSVDHDYCIRASLAKYSLIKFLNIHLHHHLGIAVKRASFKTFFLIKKEKIIHSPLRCYYMFRNMLYLENKYRGKSISLLENIRKHMKTEISKSFYYSGNAFGLKKYIRKAKKDFKESRMGKIEE